MRYCNTTPEHTARRCSRAHCQAGAERARLWRRRCTRRAPARAWQSTPASPCHARCRAAPATRARWLLPGPHPTHDAHTEMGSPSGHGAGEPRRHCRACMRLTPSSRATRASARYLSHTCAPHKNPSRAPTWLTGAAARHASHARGALDAHLSAHKGVLLRGRRAQVAAAPVRSMHLRSHMHGSTAGTDDGKPGEAAHAQQQAHLRAMMAMSCMQPEHG